jgi:competence protein ComEC
MSWNSRHEPALQHLAREAGARWRLPWRGWGVFGLGVLAGTLLQVQQSRLSSTALYGAALLLGALGLVGLAWGRRRAALASVAWRVLAGLLAGMVAWGGAGLRGAQLLQQALAPELEGRDLVLVGQVASLPLSGDWGWRFVLRVESARWLGRPVAVPPELLLGWNPRQHPARGLGDHDPDRHSDGDSDGEGDLVEGLMGEGAGGSAVGAGQAPEHRRQRRCSGAWPALAFHGAPQARARCAQSRGF